LSENGQVIVNNQKILPPAVFTGQQEYPPDVLERIMQKAPKTIVVDGPSVAKNIGNPKVLNVIFLGVLSKFLDIPSEIYEQTLRETLKPKLVDINIRAFNEGRSMGPA
ncbi:MAG: 2-oxoacid:acceptor oxidoreductase family protein, partial [Desulfomonilaceae bacterium]